MIHSVNKQQTSVAPLVGAWIEIETVSRIQRFLLSLPSWERGLKFYEPNISPVSIIVAPLVGAWIEIAVIYRLSDIYSVAPLVGAWIEIHSRRRPAGRYIVAPLVGAWIEM